MSSKCCRRDRCCNYNRSCCGYNNCGNSCCNYGGYGNCGFSGGCGSWIWIIVLLFLSGGCGGCGGFSGGCF